MGQAVARAARARGHEVVLAVGKGQDGLLAPQSLRQADLAIEFSHPEAAFAHCAACFEADLPVVCGTTGWLHRLEELERLRQARDSAFFYASNFSVGVNLFFELCRGAARLMDGHPGLVPRLREVHHVHKLDAPSGTAIAAAQALLQEMRAFDGWALGQTAPEGKLPIEAVREGEVFGFHELLFEGPHDRLVVSHEALSREGFANGAVLAAEFLLGRRGVYGMKDLLHL